MKTLCKILLCVIALCLLSGSQTAYADTASDLNDQVDKGLSNLDFSDLDELSEPFFGNFVSKVKQIISGETDSAQTFFQLALEAFGSNILDILPQLVAIFCVLAVCGLVRHTADGFISQDTSQVIGFVGVSVVLTSVLSLVVVVYKQVTLMINQTSALTDAAMPILLTLVIANGGNAVSTVCQPSMVVFSSLVIEVVRNIILPLSVFSLAFAVVSNISQNLRVNKACEFLTSASGWILGVVFMLFSAFTTVQGIAASTVDGVSFRAAKFAAKNYIPILGGYISDGFDIIVASTTLIKNSFGAVTLLLLIFLTLKPLVSLVCVNLGLQAVAAISEPIVDARYTKILGGVSKNLTFLSALVVAVAFMFCILVFIAMFTANG